MICDWWISIRFQCFQGSLLVMVIIMTAGKNAIVKAAFEL